MSSKRTESNDESNSSDIVHRSFTMGERHDNLLDDLEEARYASRSEALRAAIESLSKSVLESGDTEIEQLSARIERLGTKIDDLGEQLDEIQQHSQFRTFPGNPNPSGTGSSTDQIAAAVETTETEGTAALENEVYSLLSEQGPMNVLDIADCVDTTELDVREALDQLADRGFVASSNQDGTIEYRIKE